MERALRRFGTASEAPPPKRRRLKHRRLKHRRLNVASVSAHAGPATGLADSAGLRATVFGAPAQAMAPLPAKVPLSEINIEFP